MLSTLSFAQVRAEFPRVIRYGGTLRDVDEKNQGTTQKRGECKCGSHNLKYDGLLVHDLRRTGVRSRRRLGFGEKTIMEISAYKTASVFRRYDIVDEADLAEVAAASARWISHS